MSKSHGKVAEQRAMVVAVGAVLHRGSILLIRRNFEPFVGHWGMPGGKVRFGEHVEDAVVREVREECGVRTEFRRFCGVLSERVRLGLDKAGMHYLVLVSELRVGRASRRQSAESPPRLSGDKEMLAQSREGEVRWFSVKDLRGLRKAMIPSDYLLLERCVFNKSRAGYFRCEIAKQDGKYKVLSFE
jgi:8-oxo-dGTP diphosphatase